MDIHCNDLTTLCLCAFRYALDKHTGVSYDISEILIKHKDDLPEWVRIQICRDIHWARDRFNEYQYDNWNRVTEAFEVVGGE